MKKAIIILLVIMMLGVSACERKNTEESTTTATNKAEISTTREAETTEEALPTYSATRQSTAAVSNKATTKSIQPTENISEQDVNEVPPYILTVSLNDLRQIKAASESMNEAEFAEYMDEGFSSLATNGMDTLERTESILAELENVNIVYVDEPSKDEIMSFYVDTHIVFQEIATHKGFSVKCRIYTNPEDEFEYNDADILKQVNTYYVNGVTVELFENTSDGSDGFYGNIKFGENCIPFFTNTKISIEQFENIVPRIGVVQIGDIIN